jgi:hypothetical protein
LRVLRSARAGDQPDLLLDRARALAPFDDLELEIERQAAILLCANRQPLADYQITADALVRWANANLEPEVAAGVTSWTGYGAYRAGDFDASAAIYLGASGLGIPARFRLGATRNAVMALCETPRIEEALALAQEAISLANALRRASVEVRLHSLVDAMIYSLAKDQEVNTELVGALRMLDNASESGSGLLTQAAIAWRAGDNRRSRALALESAENFRAASIPYGAAIAHALACAAGDFVTEEDVDRWMNDALKGPPNIARQAAALFALGGVPCSVPIPEPNTCVPSDRRAEVLTHAEIMNALSAHRPAAHFPQPA